MRAVQRWLPHAVPRVLGEDADAGWFAMEHLAPEDHPLWKAQLLAGTVEVDFAAAVGRDLSIIHARSAADPSLPAAFANDDTFEAIRIEPYLRATGRAHPELASRFDELARVTLATKRALVHGDISPKNILHGPDGPVFLDAECAWFGDPAFDLAFCLNHLLLKGAREGADRTRYIAVFSAVADAYLAGVDWENATEIEARAAALLPAFFLARVDGKSPVEYLTDERRARGGSPLRNAADRRSAAAPQGRRRRLGAGAMSGETQAVIYLRANPRLILRSDAQHRVSKDDPASFARTSRHWNAPSSGSGQALRGPFGAPQGEGRRAPQGEVDCAPDDGRIAMTEPVIQALVARRIWDSRGRPTIEAEITLSDGATGRGIAPAGASRGSREAIDKRDGGKRFGGFDVQHALKGIAAEIAPALMGLDPFDQASIDSRLVALDGTPEQSEARGKRADRRFARRPSCGGGEPQASALALLSRRQSGDHSAAGNPDLRRRRACRTADRHPGLYDRRATRQKLRRGAGGHGRGLSRGRRDHGRARPPAGRSRRGRLVAGVFEQRGSARNADAGNRARRFCAGRGRKPLARRRGVGIRSGRPLSPRSRTA